MLPLPFDWGWLPLLRRRTFTVIEGPTPRAGRRVGFVPIQSRRDVRQLLHAGAQQMTHAATGSLVIAERV